MTRLSENRIRFLCALAALSVLAAAAIAQDPQPPAGTPAAPVAAAPAAQTPTAEDVQKALNDLKAETNTLKTKLENHKPNPAKIVTYTAMLDEVTKIETELSNAIGPNATGSPESLLGEIEKALKQETTGFRDREILTFLHTLRKECKAAGAPTVPASPTLDNLINTMDGYLKDANTPYTLVTKAECEAAVDAAKKVRDSGANLKSEIPKIASASAAADEPIKTWRKLTGTDGTKLELEIDGAATVWGDALDKRIAGWAKGKGEGLRDRLKIPASLTTPGTDEAVFADLPGFLKDLTKLAEEEKAFREALNRLRAQRPGLTQVLGIGGKGRETEMFTPLRTLRDTVKTGVRDKMKGWLLQVENHCRKRLTALNEGITNIGAFQRPQANNPASSVSLAEALRATEQAAKLVTETESAITGFETLLQNIKTDSYNVEGPGPFADLSGSTWADLLRVREEMQRARAKYEDAVAGEKERFVVDQVRLFYFTDMRRLMAVLNKNTNLYNPEDRARLTAVEDARKKLIGLDAQLLAQRQQVAELKRELTILDEQIRTTTAQLTAAQKKVDAEKAILKRIENEKTDETNARTRLVSERADLEMKRSAETDAAKQKALDDKIKAANDKIAERDTALEKLNQKETGQKRLVEDAEGAQNRLKSETNNLETKKQTLETQRTTTESELRLNMADLTETRGLIEETAREESRLFAEARDNAPFLYAPPNAFSNDPANRVILYAYPDSKTIFIRGLVEDVEAVKEIIATFDRPAPQARVTLYTLQVSGQFNKDLNLALGEVDSTLRDLRSEVALVQTALRDALNEEIARTEYVARLASPVAGTEYEPFAGRLARAMFYPREVRRAQGFWYEPPKYLWHLAELQCELELMRQYLTDARAHERDLRAIETNRANVRDKKAILISLRHERNADMRAAGYHFQRAMGAVSELRRVDEESGGGSYSYAFLEPIGEAAASVRAMVILATRQETDGQHSASDPLRTVFEATTVPTPMPSAVDQAIEGLDAARDLVVQYINDWRERATRREFNSWERFMTVEERRDVENITRWTLPDPTNTTTLGEMLFVSLLGKREARERVLNNFRLQVDRTFYMQKVNPSGPPMTAKGVNSITLTNFRNAIMEQYVAGGKGASVSEGYPFFVTALIGSTRSATPHGAEHETLTANQREILTAIQTRSREAVGAEVRHLLNMINRSRKSFGVPSAANPRPGDEAGPAAEEVFRQQYRPLVGWMQSFLVGSNTGSGPVIQPQAPGTTWAALAEDYLATGSPDPLGQDKVAYSLADLARTRNALSSATGRVAAADDMIKRMIQVFENDLEYFFVTPALDNLRTNIGKRTVQLGVLEKESLLLTNRLVGRVDPRSSADLQLGETQDFLAASQQFGNLLQNYQAKEKGRKAVGSAPLIGALGTALAGADNESTIAGVAGLTGLLTDLAAVPDNDPGEVYSITGGKLFQITPIFDPSGQALRFRFDYTGTIHVAEPDGSRNPLLPRIERHSVNTEVQLTNLEFREISAFGFNAKLGLPVRRTGGIPLLKELPLLKDLPIVGYYTRKRGQQGVRQESILFAQSSLYPTISDIIALLTDVPIRSDLDGKVPEYLYGGYPDRKK